MTYDREKHLAVLREAKARNQKIAAAYFDRQSDWRPWWEPLLFLLLPLALIGVCGICFVADDR